MLALKTRPDPVTAFQQRLRNSHGRRRHWGRSARRGAMFALLTAIVVWVTNTVVYLNFHVVIPGHIFRSAQPNDARLRQWVARHGIRTVVNLRGSWPEADWYENECRLTAELDLSQEDVAMSALRLPAPHDIRQLIAILDQAESPILIHCRQGVDRTGLVTVMARLLYSNDTLAQARRQLSLRYGHISWRGTRNMGRFFDLYADWLDRLDVVHSPALFRHWAEREYSPGACRCRLEWIGPSGPRSIPAGQSSVIRLRAWNRSPMAWRLSASPDAGIHAHFFVHSSQGPPLQLKAGLMERVVEPNESIDFELVLPPLKAGAYLLNADLCERSRDLFTQFGNEPLEMPLHVRE